MRDDKLCALAKAAAKNAYAPYSGCCVGAALLSESGKVYTGTNVENASFSLTVCAERSAFSAAIVAGERSFCAIAVCALCAGEESLFPPCGACLQVMTEFCDPASFRILVAGEGTVKSFLLKELLPHPFLPEKVAKGESK